MKLKKITCIIGLLCSFNMAYAATPVEDLDVRIRSKFPMATDIKELSESKDTYSFNIGSNNIVITNSNFDYIYFDNELYISNNKGEFSPVKNINLANNPSVISETKQVEQHPVLENKEIKYLAKNIKQPLLNNKDLDDSLNILMKEIENNPVFNYKDGNGDVKASTVWENIDLSNALKQVYGTGENEVIILTDPDCPYCQSFEKMLDENKDSFNVTVYKIPFFLNSHPKAPEKFKFIYSQPDPEKAYTDWMSYSISGDENDNEIAWRKWISESNRKLGNIDNSKYNNLLTNSENFIKKYNFRSTPTVLFKNGVISTNGLMSAEEFELFLKFSQKSPNIVLPEQFKN